MEKQEIIDLIDALNQLEVKGKNNIYILYKTFIFLQSKINAIEEKEK